MSVSIRSALSVARECLPPGILNPSIDKALAAIAPVLRTSCSSYYLEWHTAEPARTDLLCSLTLSNSSTLTSAISKHTGGTSGSRWHTLYRFLTSWQTINATLDGQLPHIWLAFDFNAIRQSFDPPNIHFCIDKKFRSRLRSPLYTNTISPKRFNQTIDTLIAHFFSDVPSLSPASFKRCYKKITAVDGEVLHLSFMHSRTPPVFKFNMTIPSASLPEILKSVNWQGDRNRLMALCNDFTQTENRIKGNLCMDGNTCHRFELELEYNTPLLSDKRRTAMLQLLVRHHLLSREQSHNLKKWPGQSEITWRSSAYTFERWLDMKICCEPCGAIIAKPYLGFAPLPRLGWNRQEVDD